jgi:hypothetical protein
VVPLGFEWVKLYEICDAMPSTRLPVRVLYRIELNHGDRWRWPEGRPDLARIEIDVRQIALDGMGLVDAYEIGNEPNMAWQWMGQPPDPADYVAVLRTAYTAIKEVDPGALVVSGGLGPVGRIDNTCEPAPRCLCTANSGVTYEGNNCQVMDERAYARELFRLGAGDTLDAFGYHPAGFAYEPERALDDLPDHDRDNDFAFRGAEVMHQIMVEYGLDDTPLWATEFGWVRDPSEDGGEAVWCHTQPSYEDNFGWMDVPETLQADYLVRAFEYADVHWPWMGAMFVWNLDWHDQGWLCDHVRYYSIRKDDGTDLGAPSLAVGALAAMQKRPGHFGPHLAVVPPALTFLAAATAPRVLTATLVPENVGYGTFTWTATTAPGLALTPTLVVTGGLPGEPLTVTVDSTGYPTGTFAGLVTVAASGDDVLDPLQAVPVRLVVAELRSAYLPLMIETEP